MAKRFDYGWAGSEGHGLMICACCHKPITQGQYRYRDAGDRYITHHRACCPNDPTWARGDAEYKRLMDRYEQMRQDALAFYAKWGLTDIANLVDADHPATPAA